MKRADISGQKFGRLTATRLVRLTPSAWECICDCGATREVLLTNLRSGRQKSCGCLRAERRLKHGMASTKIYKAWNSMIQRCHNPNNAAFKDYGARGITVCPAWHEFPTFYADVGRRPKDHTLERIDNNKGYSPDNVRWATMSEQHENRRGVNFYEHKGKRMTLTAWARHLGVHRELLRGRLRRGAPFSEIVRTISS